MTTEQKIIRAKVRLLELAKQLGNVSQAFAAEFATMRNGNGRCGGSNFDRGGE
jgi:hypothetical protein